MGGVWKAAALGVATSPFPKPKRSLAGMGVWDRLEGGPNPHPLAHMCLQ